MHKYETSENQRLSQRDHHSVKTLYVQQTNFPSFEMHTIVNEAGVMNTTLHNFYPITFQLLLSSLLKAYNWSPNLKAVYPKNRTSFHTSNRKEGEWLPCTSLCMHLWSSEQPSLKIKVFPSKPHQENQKRSTTSHKKELKGNSKREEMKSRQIWQNTTAKKEKGGRHKVRMRWRFKLIYTTWNRPEKLL